MLGNQSIDLRFVQKPLNAGVDIMQCSGNQSIDLRVVQKPLKRRGRYAPGTSLCIFVLFRNY